jgi:hypothetical protein
MTEEQLKYKWEQTTEQLDSMIRYFYEDFDEAGSYISPNELTESVMNKIFSGENAPALVRVATQYYILERVRDYRRLRQTESESMAVRNNRHCDLELPRRYAVEREVNGEWEEVYVLRNDLTLLERVLIACRLRSEAAAMQRQAEAFDPAPGITMGRLAEEANRQTVA